MFAIDDLSDPPRNLDNCVTHNSYCGRGLGVGQNSKGEYFFIYFLTGRSADSQNRRFVAKSGSSAIIRTAQVRRKKIPKNKRRLIIYNALGIKDVKKTGLRLAFATNGAQTDTLLSLVNKPKSFETVCGRWGHEPDKPNYTARISGMLVFDKDGINEPQAKLSMIKRMDSKGDDKGGVVHLQWEPNIHTLGSCNMITTYKEDGKPLPPYEGPPFSFQIDGTAKQIGTEIWKSLPEKVRVALVVRTFKKNGQIVNTFVVNGRDEVR